MQRTPSLSEVHAHGPGHYTPLCQAALKWLSLLKRAFLFGFDCGS